MKGSPVTVSLPQMRGFVTLAKHLSFKRAAVELGITQPALSSQITALERTLGVQLLARTTRSARLTLFAVMPFWSSSGLAKLVSLATCSRTLRESTFGAQENSTGPIV